jgi:hypothetical protein
MNTLRTSPWSWSVPQLSCLALCAVGLTGVAAADAIVTSPMLSLARSELAQVRSHRTVTWADTSALPSAWASPELVPVWQRPDMTVVRRPADLLSDQEYLIGSSGFDTSNLFRTRKEQKYRDTLRLLLTKRQLRVWLREDLHLQCEVKRYRSLDQGREMGVKLGLYYRFD